MPDRPLESFQSRGFGFAVEILKLYRQMRSSSDVPAHLANQILRAGTAIGANLEEARSAFSKRDLASKQTVSLREGRECLFWLRLIAADQPRFASAVAPLLDECHQMVAMLTTSVKKLRAARHSLLASGFWLLP